MKFFTVLSSLLLLATPALAYVGPGAGLGAIGVLIAVIGGILLLVVGFLWYPIKRMMRARKDANTAEGDTSPK